MEKEKDNNVRLRLRLGTHSGFNLTKRASLRLFLHMPKCAGVSVREYLTQFVDGDILLDYDSHFKLPKLDRNKELLSTVTKSQKTESKVIYGHFFPVKYFGSGLPSNMKLVTILRDPIDRLISHYHFWNSDVFDHYLWRKMKSENWSLEQFIMAEEMRNFYSQYLILCPIQLFTYIGLFNNLEPSIHNCFEALGVQYNRKLPVPKLNSNPNKYDYGLSHSFHKEAKLFHADDYLLYDYAKLKFHA